MKNGMGKINKMDRMRHLYWSHHNQCIPQNELPSAQILLAFSFLYFLVPAHIQHLYEPLFYQSSKVSHFTQVD